jgi:broad specificity phosphatase PhoE
MFELLLIRHGQTDWNVERRVMGDKPIPLNITGKAQARALAKKLKDVHVSAVFTSPVMRAIQTSRPLLTGRQSVALYEDEGLKEINYGDWTGRTFSEIEELPKYFIDPLSIDIPNGEKIPDVQSRIVSSIEAMRSRYPEGRVAAISHADPIKLAVMKYLGIALNDMYKLRIDNGSVTVVHFNSTSNPRVVVVNCVDDWQRYCNQ